MVGEIRMINAFWNQLSESWIFDTICEIIPSRNLCGVVSVYLGSVEYTDGTVIDLYQQCGKVVGVEYTLR